jgi:predicted dienelactone hydrolase
MDYDPFTRGPFPAGVRSLHLTDTSRDERPVPVEIWYPATESYNGKDLAEDTRDRFEAFPGFPGASQDAVRDAAPRVGSYPLVGFSHGWGGHRRQSTFLCTHLASHGFAVAAVDHAGNTVADVVRIGLAKRAGRSQTNAATELRVAVDIGPEDVSFMLEQILSGAAAELASLIDAERIGMMGHSYGGWTTLTMAARDPRIRAALALAPAGGASSFRTNPLKDALRFNWSRDIPVLFIAADHDSVLPLPGMYELFESIRVRGKKMVVVHGADHFHFVDRAEQVHEFMRAGSFRPFDRIAHMMRPIAELSQAQDVYLAVSGLSLAHMDSALNGSSAAAQFLAGDIPATLADRGVTVTVV